MDTDEHRYSVQTGTDLKQLTEVIIGSAFAVLNELGNGLQEKVYENALCVELTSRGLRFAQQRRFPVFYKKVQVGMFIPDLLVEDQVIVDLKTIEQITDQEAGQVLNYLRITKLRLALILNFQHARLQTRRVIL
jgi:GxxExxY protein